MEELKDFIDDWNIDIKNKSAIHKSGLKIAYDATNEDGSLRLAYTGMMKWQKLAYSITHDIKKIDEMREMKMERWKERLETINRGNSQ